MLTVITGLVLGGILVIVADVWNKSTKKVSALLYASIFNFHFTRPKLSHLSMKKQKRKKKLQNQKSQMATATNRSLPVVALEKSRVITLPSAPPTCTS